MQERKLLRSFSPNGKMLIHSSSMKSIGNVLKVVDKTTSKHVRAFWKAYVMFPLQNKYILTVPFPKCHQEYHCLQMFLGRRFAKSLSVFQASNRHFTPFPFYPDKPFLSLLQKLGDLPGGGIPLGWVLCGSHRKLTFQFYSRGHCARESL